MKTGLEFNKRKIPTKLGQFIFCRDSKRLYIQDGQTKEPFSVSGVQALNILPNNSSWVTYDADDFVHLFDHVFTHLNLKIDTNFTYFKIKEAGIYYLDFNILTRPKAGGDIVYFDIEVNGVIKLRNYKTFTALVMENISFNTILDLKKDDTIKLRVKSTNSTVDIYFNSYIPHSYCNLFKL